MKQKYFEIWFEDKQSILETMVRNMQADLAVGYDYFGKSITEQRADIDKYKKETDSQMEQFKQWDERKVNHWCYYDLRKRGVI